MGCPTRVKCLLPVAKACLEKGGGLCTACLGSLRASRIAEVTERDRFRLTAYGSTRRSHCERVAMAIKKLTIFQEAERLGDYARS